MIFLSLWKKISKASRINCQKSTITSFHIMVTTIISIICCRRCKTNSSLMDAIIIFKIIKTSNMQETPQNPKCLIMQTWMNFKNSNNNLFIRIEEDSSNNSKEATTQLKNLISKKITNKMEGGNSIMNKESININRTLLEDTKDKENPIITNFLGNKLILIAKGNLMVELLILVLNTKDKSQKDSIILLQTNLTATLIIKDSNTRLNQNLSPKEKNQLEEIILQEQRYLSTILKIQ